MIKGFIGCEIECLIPRDKAGALRRYCDLNNIDFGDDGSVHNGEINESGKHNRGDLLSVELRGDGFIFDIEDLNSFFNRIEEVFNLGIKVNASCGLHIHLSFNNHSTYFKLLNYDYVIGFQEKLNSLLTTEYERRRLINHFCAFYRDEDDFKKITSAQLLYRGKCCERYKLINYNSYNLRKTIEYRIFPATRYIKTFKRYVAFLLSYTESYLNEHKEEFKIIESFNPSIKKVKSNIIVKLKPIATDSTDNTTTPAESPRTEEGGEIFFSPSSFMIPREEFL